MVEEKSEETKEVKEVKKRYEFVEVPTEMAIVIKDNKTDKLYQKDEVLLEILNKLNTLVD